MSVAIRVVETKVPLSAPFTISRGSQTEAALVHLALTHDGVTGWGEGSPAAGVTGERFEDTVAALARLRPDAIDPGDIAATLARHAALAPAARAALDLALHDLAGRVAREPVHKLLGLPDGEAHTAATVTLTDSREAARQARAWYERNFTTLKVKVGRGATGLQVVEAVRNAAPDATIWVDANEALTPSEARAILPRLADLGVELFEQPVQRGDVKGIALVCSESPIPIVLDESIQHASDVGRFASVDGNLGFNVKVQKVGGLAAAKACLAEARRQDRRVLVGCNIESGLGIAAGAVFTGAADWLDLDGNLFLVHDPFPLPRPLPGYVGTAEGPGLGVTPDPRHVAFERRQTVK